MSRGAWQATVHGVARVGHDWATEHTHTHTHTHTHRLTLIHIYTVKSVDWWEIE